jgi:hypothetical protein
MLGSPRHVVEKHGVALTHGEAQLVREVLRIRGAEHVHGDAMLLQPAQALLGLLDGQAGDEALHEVLLRLHSRGGPRE